MAEGYKSRLTGADNPNYTPVEQRFWEKVEKTPGCWLWTGYCNPESEDGSAFLPYGRIKERGRLRLAHRVSWEIKNGPIPEGRQVAHHCDNPRCVRPSHLFLATPSDNAQDMWDKGRGGGKTKLTHDQVREIRRRYASEEGHSYASLADEYGVHKSTVADIITRRSWSDL